MDNQTLYTDNIVAQEDLRRYEPVSTGAFFGYKLLYGIPVIGWLLCLIFSFTEKNVNKRNFARATLIGLIISLVITCVIGFAVVKVAEMVFEQVAMEALGGSMEELGPMMDVLEELRDGKHDALIQRIENGEFGDAPELAALMKDLRSKGLPAIISEFQSGGFEDVAMKFAMGSYDDLITRANNGELGDLGALGELLAQLANGDVSDLPLQ